MRAIVTISAFAVLAGASWATAQLPPPITLPTPPPTLVTVRVPLSVFGNQAQGAIRLPGGIGADLTITFERVVGLNPSALEVWASLVNPLDPALVGRLPLMVSVPTAFPVLVRVSPSASSMLSFAGVYTITFHTDNLRLDLLRPLSLLKSPEGGPFRDITRSEGIGSYRDDGSGGDFSEFLIALDFRPIDSVIAGKFDDLQTLLNENAASMQPDTFSTLQGFLSRARELYQSGAVAEAIVQMKAFSDYVKAHSGEEIPDVWRANCTPESNVGGQLRSAANTLRFSLDRKASR
jgi:Family of unknown function (DUF6689)